MADADWVLVSLVSAWELAILVRLRRLELGAGIGETIRGPGLGMLDIRIEHIERLAELPMLHRVHSTAC